MSKINKVLVIDDSKLARLTLSRLLVARNISVIDADSVEDALEFLSKESVDAIFLDVQMPNKSGFVGLKIFKDTPSIKHIPVSMYSGDISPEAHQEAIDRGAQAYLCKPASNEHLDAVLVALSENILAENMQVYAKASGATSIENILKQHSANQAKHKRVIVALDERTNTLARLFNIEKKSTGATIHNLVQRSEKIENDLDSLKKHNEYAQNDDLLHKHAENDIRGQLKKMRDNQRMLMTTSIISIILCITSFIFALIVYFRAI